jgi:hypothetical protein
VIRGSKNLEGEGECTCDEDDYNETGRGKRLTPNMQLVDFKQVKGAIGRGKRNLNTLARNTLAGGNAVSTCLVLSLDLPSE